MLILITEYEWKLGEPLEDGSAILDILPTVGGQIPVRLAISPETRATLIEKLSEGRVKRADLTDLAREAAARNGD